MNTTYIGIGIKETIYFLAALKELGLIKNIESATKQHISIGDYPFIEQGDKGGPFTSGTTFFNVRIDNKVYSMTHHEQVKDGKHGMPIVVQIYNIVGEKEL